MQIIATDKEHCRQEKTVLMVRSKLFKRSVTFEDSQTGEEFYSVCLKYQSSSHYLGKRRLLFIWQMDDIKRLGETVNQHTEKGLHVFKEEILRLSFHRRQY